MMKGRLLFGGLCAVSSAFCHVANAQMAEIPPQNHAIAYVSSQTAADTAAKAFDGDTSTWWAVNTSQLAPLPAVLILDLGEEHKVCGVRYLCNPQNDGDKLKGYAVHVTKDSSDWGEPQAQGEIFWNADSDVAPKDLLFGAVTGRFVKITYLKNSNTWNQAVQTAELRVLADESAVPGRKNQLLRFDKLPVLVSSQDTVYLDASASSGLPVAFSVISGAGSVIERNDSCFLVSDGTEGVTVLEALQAGDGEYYPVRHVFGVQIQNPMLYGVRLYTPLVESEIIAMPSDTLVYPLQARAEIGSAFNKITGMSVEVDGKMLEARYDEASNTLRADFVPGRYGRFTVKFHAEAGNGRDTTVTRLIEVDSIEASRTVRAFDHMLINFPEPGRTNGGVFVFPQHVGSYQRIIAKLDMKCPPIEGGCDDWDRVAWVEMQTPDGQWREIIRYTTAYGVPCHHQLDVSDFSSWLQGEVPMRMFIDTWGSGGYDVTLDFQFVKGMPQYLYSGLIPLWNGNFPFGDPANLQPMDTLDVEVPSDAAALSLKVVTTGHGWGGNNTSNAAEFYKAEHHIYVNGTAYEHTPWMKCKPNPDTCLNQRGTWTYNRAGWCPGAIAPGYHYNPTGHLDQSRLDMRFIFEPDYVDHCHPHNPDCVSGKTCADCNDTYNPQYYIASYLVTFYDQMYDSLPQVANEQVAGREELRFSLYPNPASGRFFVQTYGQTGRGSLQIVDMNGTVVRNRVFGSGEELNAMAIGTDDLPAGVYMVCIRTLHGNGIKKLIVR